MTAQYDSAGAHFDGASRCDFSDHEWSRYWYLLVTTYVRSLGIELPVGADFPSPEYMRDIGRHIVDGAARAAAEKMLKEAA